MDAIVAKKDAKERLSDALTRRSELRRRLRRRDGGPDLGHDRELYEALGLEIEGLREEVRSQEEARRNRQGELRKMERSILRAGGPRATSLRALRTDISSTFDQLRTCRAAVRKGRRIRESLQRAASASRRISGAIPGFPRALEVIERQRVGPYVRWMTSSLKRRLLEFAAVLEPMDLPISAGRILENLGREPHKAHQDVDILLGTIERRERALERELDKLEERRLRLVQCG